MAEVSRGLFLLANTGGVKLEPSSRSDIPTDMMYCGTIKTVPIGRRWEKTPTYNMSTEYKPFSQFVL